MPKAGLEFKLTSTVKDKKNEPTEKGGSEVTLICYLMRSVTSEVGK